jgi:hypothetical protein
MVYQPYATIFQVNALVFFVYLALTHTWNTQNKNLTDNDAIAET